MQTIVELPTFPPINEEQKACLLLRNGRSLLPFLATNPKAGVLIQGTEGIRKIRGHGAHPERLAM